MDEAQRLGLKIAAIFYDDIPKYRPELQTTCKKHHDYMRELFRADVVLSISRWSNDDLLGFARDEGVKPDEDWAITFPLPAQSILGNRVIDIHRAYQENKFILSVGSITPHKNQLSLARVFASYSQKNNTDWKLLLVGTPTPELAIEIQKLAHKNPNIHS